MDKSAVVQIQQSVSTNRVNDELNSHGTTEPCIIVPEGFVLASIDEKMANPAFFKHTFSTKSVDDYVAYCDKHSAEVDSEKVIAIGASCFINEDTMSAITIFDLGDETLPGHGFHKAQLNLVPTPEYSALIAACHAHTEHKQIEASDFLEDWRDNITVVDDRGATMPTDNACVAFRNMKIHEVKERQSTVGNFGGTQSAMESIEANKDNSLPALIHFQCKPYRDIPEREFVLRVSILVGLDKPRIKFRVVRSELHTEEMAIEFKDMIIEKFGGLNIDSYIGSAN